jgi:Spy/CpxP family protein refolding chaperone
MWIVAVFVLAAALGSVSGYLYGHRAPGPPLSDDARRQQKVTTLTKELQLTPEQQTQIDAIFRDTQGKFQTIRKDADAQIEVARQAGRERLRSVLTPEQKPKFEEFLRRLDEDRKNRTPAR